MTRSRALRLEVLEDRTVPTVFGVPWPDGAHLTVSFVPDGTQAGPTTSQLFSVLDARYGREVWQRAVLSALQSWVPYANINFGLVGDDGSPLGAAGVVQGDPRFGDVRFAAYPISDDLAVASPFDALGGTWAGDVKLNSTAFAAPSAPDLWTVVLHEVGHSLGLDHSTDPNSPLFETYHGPSHQPTADDIARLQALYGPRLPDAYDAQAPNGTIDKSSTLSQSGGVWTATADVTTPDDVDVYKLPPLGKDGGVIRLGTAGLSLLEGRLSVLDAYGRELAFATATGPGGDVVLTLDAQTARLARYVRVGRGADDLFSVGGYRLEVTPSPAAPTPGVTGPNGIPQSPVVNLQQRTTRTDSRFDYFTHGALGLPGEVDQYRFLAPKPADGAGQVMTVMVWGGASGVTQPTVDLFDSLGQRIAAQVLVNENGTLVLQVPNAPTGGALLLSLHDAAGGTGNYALGIDFSTRTTTLDALVPGGLLTTPAGESAGSLTLTESQLLHLVLSASGPGAGVQVTVSDADGNVVATLTAASGQTVSTTPWLPAGNYSLHAAPLAGPDGVVSPVSYTLQSLRLTDPIGPTPLDVLSSPTPTTSGSVSTTTYWWQLNLGGVIVVQPLPMPSFGTSPPALSPAPASTSATTTEPTASPAPVMTASLTSPQTPVAPATAASADPVSIPSPPPATTPVQTPVAVPTADVGASLTPRSAPETTSVMPRELAALPVPAPRQAQAGVTGLVFSEVAGNPVPVGVGLRQAFTTGPGFTPGAADPAGGPRRTVPDMAFLGAGGAELGSAPTLPSTFFPTASGSSPVEATTGNGGEPLPPRQVGGPSKDSSDVPGPAGPWVVVRGSVAEPADGPARTRPEAQARTWQGLVTHLVVAAGSAGLALLGLGLVWRRKPEDRPPAPSLPAR